MKFLNFAALTTPVEDAASLSNAEKLTEGLTVLLLGMATVFAVLAILWLVLALFKVIFYRENKPAEKKVKTPAPAPKPAPAPAPVPAPAAADDAALVAAITAAIAAYTANDTAFASGFRVVSFRRSEHASPWTRNGK